MVLKEEEKEKGAREWYRTFVPGKGSDIANPDRRYAAFRQPVRTRRATDLDKVGVSF
jgi:hypothetical protein